MICSIIVTVVYIGLAICYVSCFMKHEDGIIDIIMGRIGKNHFLVRILGFLCFPMLLQGLLGMVAIMAVSYLLYNLICTITAGWLLISKLRQEKQLAAFGLFTGSLIYSFIAALLVSFGGPLLSSLTFQDNEAITSVLVGGNFLTILLISDMVLYNITKTWDLPYTPLKKLGLRL